MNDLMIRIGYAVATFFTSMDTTGLLDALSIMGIGMLGIFIVTGVIILVITLLGKVFAGKK